VAACRQCRRADWVWLDRFGRGRELGFIVFMGIWPVGGNWFRTRVVTWGGSGSWWFGCGMDIGGHWWCGHRCLGRCEDGGRDVGDKPAGRLD